MQQTSPKTRTSRNRSRGMIAVEFLLAFPVAFIFLLGIVEFGLFLTNLRHVDDACFQAAREAAKLDRDDLHNGVNHANQRAGRVLQTAGLGRPCFVMIEHNVPGGGSSPQVLKYRRCDRHPNSVGPLPNNDRVAAVRCTVIVPMRQLTPDLLAWVGFSLRHRYSRSIVTVPYVGGRRHDHDHGNGHGHGKHGKKHD